MLAVTKQIIYHVIYTSFLQTSIIHKVAQWLKSKPLEKIFLHCNGNKYEKKNREKETSLILLWIVYNKSLPMNSSLVIDPIACMYHQDKSPKIKIKK